ncbi:MAG TPA: DUF3467 domain-containing protein [Bacteroidota bacterium]|nr:DUF3467 domain-containing protein [Bacteroidota bacterium]
MSDINPDMHGQQQVNIELGPAEAEGIYSNLAIITHSNAEFVIDFTRVLPGIPRAKVHARLVMTPVHAKSLLNALRDNIEKFERKFGEIKVAQDPGQMFSGVPPTGAMH